MDDLLSQYLLKGDLIGFIIALYTSVMGEVFFAFILLGISVPLYIRTQSLAYVTVVWIILGALLEAIIPTTGLSLGKILMVLGVAAILYQLFVRERG